MTRRLESGGWPDGVMPVIAGDFHEAAAFRVMPLVADGSEGETRWPRSLQHRLDEHPGLDSWKLVKALARALAAMHARRVTHGNLKPGNVFFNDRGELLLTDWALGNMPGVRHFEFTDAVLYQAPEQLRHAEGYLDEAGYGWDVFSFGVLAFRILTGNFPRCHDTFVQVAPPQGETRREGLRADLGKIANNLEAQAEIKWPDGDCSPLESGMRGWIDRCLELDPAKRPYDMGEVAAGLESVEKELVAGQEQRELVDRGRGSAGRARWAFSTMAAALVLALVMAGLWHDTRTRLVEENARHANESSALKGELESALQQQQAAEERGVLAEETLAHEREAWLARLEGTLETGDLLFSWAMEQGRRRLPPLDGREQRLKRLESRFEEFLTNTAEDPDMVEERARVRLQLAELSLAADDAEAATRRIGEALKMWAALPMNADMKLRVATNSLWLALLKQAAGDPETAAAFDGARKALAAVPRAEVDADRLDHLLATLDFHESKLLAARGDETKALEQLMRATRTLNLISDRRPDTAILGSELASCHLATANIFDGAGEPGNASEVRKLAVTELAKLLEKKPEDPTLQSELAACYGAMAEAAMLAGDVSGAESLSREAMKLLDQLLAAQPDHIDAISRKAAQLGLRAGILRDRGQSEEAMRTLDEGIRMLESVRATAPGDAMVAYRLAQLWWQKGRMAGSSGLRDEEIALLGRARDLLDSLLAESQVSGPLPGQLRRSSAYLAGDLGHALQLANRKGDAARAFSAAVSLWQELLKSRPRNEENQEGLSWSRQRLEDLK
jgi:eukaryotic-like serine/threonine-protein kinase